MIDVTIIGGGNAARACADLLSAAGFGVRRTFEFDDEDRSPIVVGELPAAITVARQAVESGRHLLISTPALFSPERLSMLYEGRRKAQALFLWSNRRYHPSYRFVSSLIESDSTWQPRYVRQETMLVEAPAAGLANWNLIESTALVLSYIGDESCSVGASGAANPMRNANELVRLSIDAGGRKGFVQVGLGEAMERRETLIAGHRRKVFIDELNQSVPVRMLTDEPGEHMTSSRWLSTTAPSNDEMARQQVLSFLDSTLHPEQTQAEALLWSRALSVVEASRQSLLNLGAEVEVEFRESEVPRFRILPNTA